MPLSQNKQWLLDIWRFRSKSATDSDLIRPPIPFEIGH